MPAAPGPSTPPGYSIGRISGPMLTQNLLRNGVDLTFRNAALDDDLLYLDVTNRRIGINANPPNFTLDITGDGKITGDLLASGTLATFDNIRFNSNGSITSTVGPINIVPVGVDAYVELGRAETPSINIDGNRISGAVLNEDIVLNASGTGRVVFQRDTAILGNLAVTGNIQSTETVQLNGQLIIGDSPIDTVTIAPDFTQSIVPGSDDQYDIGSPSHRWNDTYIVDLNGSQNPTITNLIVGDQANYSANRIEALQSNDDLYLLPDTGTVIIENISINQGTITNLLNSPVTISHTGTGYLVINDTGAMRIPVGNNSQRLGVEVGETRWNNELGYLECFDGTIWQVATGGGTVVTPAVMEELGHVYTLIFG